MTLNNPHLDSTLTFLYNVRINQESRKNRLVANVHQILSLNCFPISIRVRGSLAHDTFQLIENGVTDLYRNDTVPSWKLNLLEQIQNSPSNFFVLLQEDHALTCNEEVLLKTIREFVKLNLDFMPLSFFPQYSLFEKLVQKSGVVFKRGEHLKYIRIDKKLARKMHNRNHYLINLIGIYKRELLIKILLSNRPIIKHFSGNSPFDVEQRPTQKWFLPIDWAIPTEEIFACIDDNHGVEGYSLISRGLHERDAERAIDHHPKEEIKYLTAWIPALASGRFLTLFRISKYSLSALLSVGTKRKIVKSLIQCEDISTKSNGPE